MEKVLVGMSGGVDSAVAAYLLKKEGYDVIGVTLRTWESSNGEESRCCEIDDARRVANFLGISYHVHNCTSEFREYVTEPFINDYINGLTPNPCIGCNRYVKWEKMMYLARVMDAKYVATGHYAFVEKLDNGRYSVKKALHAEKDQTYMLYRLSQEQLSSTLMPLGKYSKDEVREIAVKAGIPVAEKPDSQEICFVPDDDYAGFIEENAAGKLHGEGSFVDEDGKPLGKHKGIIHYTVGQRKGLGLPLGYPAYVKEIRPLENEVVISKEGSLYRDEIVLRDVNYLSIENIPERGKIRCTVKIRYHHPGRTAVIENAGEGRVRIVFDEPVKAAAPGQSAVFYDEDGCVIGGGIISGE